jgi:hypothetical protein
MITLFDLWEKFIGKANTHQGGHARPHRNFQQWVNDISVEIFEEEYQVWEKTQVISDRLMPFLKSANIIVNPVGGQMWDLVKFPADYQHFSSARVIRKDNKSCGDSELVTLDGRDGCTEVKCEFMIDADEKKRLQQQADDSIKEIVITKIKNNKWAGLLDHESDRPSWNSPACTQFDQGLKVAPKALGVIILDYLRLPVKGVFGYTIVDAGLETEYIQYDPNASTPLEWSETLINEFLNRLLKNYGTFTRDEMLYQHGENEKRTTA